MLTYEEFLTEAKRLEPLMDLPDDTFFYKSAYEFAKVDASYLAKYLPSVVLDTYLLYYGLHLIILTRVADNKLYNKYFPNNANGDSLGYVVGSVSDSTSSVSNIAYRGLQNMGFQEALFTATPYGMQLLAILEPLKYLVVTN